MRQFDTTGMGFKRIPEHLLTGIRFNLRRRSEYTRERKQKLR